MSLFGDLPPTKDEEATGKATNPEVAPSGWASTPAPSQPIKTTSMVPASLRKRATNPRPSNMMVPPHLRQRNKVAPKPAASKPVASAKPVTKPASAPAPTPPPAPSPAPAAADNEAGFHHFPIEVVDEYDPALPNDYEAFCAQRRIAEKNRAAQLKLELQLKEREAEMRRVEAERKKQAEARLAGVGMPLASGGVGRGRDLRPAWMQAQDKAGGGASKHDSRPAWMRAKEAESAVAPPAAAAPSSATVPGMSSGRGVDLRPAWMTKMEAGGVAPGASAAAPSKPLPGAAQSCVVLLQNMVAPGSVDSELEADITEECKSFGQVVDMQFKEFSDEVCVFVKFEDMECAARAVSKLHSRFFDGRSITATYYPQDRFDRGDLAPM